MKKGTRASLMAALLAVGCWACVSALQAAPLYAQSGTTGDEMYISYSSDSSVGAVIRSYLISGENGGSWGGSAAGADMIVSNLSDGAFGIKYALYGDADLDGAVTGSDFTILVGNLGKAISGWDQGNFSYDSSITGDDFTALVGDLGKQASGANDGVPAVDFAAIDAFAAANGLTADVPEPVSIGLLAIGGLAILSRRPRSA
jgi:hypothetical protein